MIEALAAAVIILTPKQAPEALPHIIPNRYQDSGHDIWDTAPKWVRELGACIRKHESNHRYTAQNPVSSAAGAYQFLTATWQGNAKWVKGAGQYMIARHAPPRVQDAVFIHSIEQGGIKAWHGTWCPGT